MNQNLRAEYIRVIIQIKRVWLAVRFNCKLSFIIRNELSEKIAEIDNTYNLFRGECLVNQTIYFELPLEVLAARSRKLKLIVMMISANGMVPAGFVNFNTYAKSPYEQFQAIMPLQRCEDARAQIKFMHMYENCTKTPVQNSFVHQLLNKQDQYLYDNGQGYSKVNHKNSHSVNREHFSNQKYRHQEQYNGNNTQKVNFSKPLVSPRTLTRYIEGSQTDKSIKVSSFQKNVDEKIAEQKQPLDSSINPLTREQLMKEHQQYWLEIIRMEEQMEMLKNENLKVNEENNTLKTQADTLKEYYEGHEEKIHAFLGQIQQNSQTIRKLEAELHQQKQLVLQKQQFEKQYHKLMQLQSNQLQQNFHNNSDLQQILAVFNEEKKVLSIQRQIKEQKILFLQNEAKRYSEENLLLKEKMREYEDKLYFLSNNNETQKNIIIELQNQILQEKKHREHVSALRQETNTLRKSYEALKDSTLIDQEKIYRLQKELLSHIEEKEGMMLESSLKDEEAFKSLSKEAEAIKELERLRRVHQNLLETSSIDQSKIKIFQKELEFSSKEREDLLFEVRRKSQEISELKLQYELLDEQSKHIRLKLIEYEAAISGKSSMIEQLRRNLSNEIKEKKALNEKNLSIEKEFQQIEAQLSKEVEESNKKTILLANLQDNYKSLEIERTHFRKYREELISSNSQLKAQIGNLKTSMKEAEQKYQEKVLQLNKQLLECQLQLTEAIEKANSFEMELQSSLSHLEEQKNTKGIVRQQYQQSYNQSMTALILKNGKLEAQLQQFKQLYNKQTEQKLSASEKLISIENEIVDIKSFTHNKLQENIKLMRENEQLKSKNAEVLNSKDEQLSALSQSYQELLATNRQNTIKIDQLANELQFVTEVLQRERQEKSDIQKEFDHNEKGQLPQIVEVGQLKEESFDSKQDVNLEIESKVVASEQSIKDEKGEPNKKKKKKR